MNVNDFISLVNAAQRVAAWAYDHYSWRDMPEELQDLCQATDTPDAQGYREWLGPDDERNN